MRTDRELAITLRKQGKSYREIQMELSVAKSTLSNWFRGLRFSEVIKEELKRKAIERGRVKFQELNRVRGEVLSAHYENAVSEAHHEFQLLFHNPLFISALVAYWGEGDKRTKSQIRITNTDPRMLQIFTKFLIEICNVPIEKISLALFIYPDLDEHKCKKYWGNKVRIEKFQKIMVLKGRNQQRRTEYGVCTVVMTNTYLKKKLQTWIDLLAESILE